jgi:NAD(P)-dependent dehydrogenase (short-subunit alcohol dehydrogenase family)
MNRVHTLLDQVALVTGVNRGIGLAIARRLGQMGARVSLCAMRARCPQCFLYLKVFPICRAGVHHGDAEGTEKLRDNDCARLPR